MTTIELVEGAPARPVALADLLADLLITQGIVTGRRLGRDRWEVAATTKVGVARLGDVIVRVAPKVDIHRLFFLLGYARKPFWRPGLVDVAASSGLLPVLAAAFVAQAERATEPGLLQGYVEVDESLAVLRGRLREQDQLRLRYGLALPLLVRYDDYTVDIAENRLLRSATDLLLRLPDVEETVRRRLRGLRLVLAETTPIPRGARLPRWQESRLNTRYHVALWLAELVLSDHAVDHHQGDVHLDGFLVDMAKVFEDFVTAALSRALEPRGGRCSAQDTRHTLDEEGDVKVRPDLVWYDGDRPRAVIDAKYKAEKPAGFPYADIYQVLAYCTALDLSVGHLVYAKGNEAARSYTVRSTRTQIFAHALDLDVADDQLTLQVDALATSIAEQSSIRGGMRPRPVSR